MSNPPFVLGRKCKFKVNGLELKSVRDVGVRRTTTEVDATGYGHDCRSTIVTHRTYEIEVEVLDKGEVQEIRRAEQDGEPILVSTEDGLVPVSKKFTLHEVAADEGLNDAVVARFSLRQWGH